MGKGLVRRSIHHCFGYIRLNLFGITGNEKQLRHFVWIYCTIMYFCAYAYACRMSQPICEYFLHHRWLAGWRAFYVLCLFHAYNNAICFYFHLIFFAFLLIETFSMRFLSALESFAAIYNFHTISHRRDRHSAHWPTTIGFRRVAMKNEIVSGSCMTSTTTTKSWICVLRLLSSWLTEFALQFSLLLNL